MSGSNETFVDFIYRAQEAQAMVMPLRPSMDTGIISKKGGDGHMQAKGSIGPAISIWMGGHSLPDFVALDTTLVEEE